MTRQTDEQINEILNGVETLVRDACDDPADRMWLISELVLGQFSWADTDEGPSYWSDVQDNLKRPRSNKR